MKFEKLFLLILVMAIGIALIFALYQPAGNVQPPESSQPKPLSLNIAMTSLPHSKDIPAMATNAEIELTAQVSIAQGAEPLDLNRCRLTFVDMFANPVGKKIVCRAGAALHKNDSGYGASCVTTFNSIDSTNSQNSVISRYTVQLNPGCPKYKIGSKNEVIIGGLLTPGETWVGPEQESSISTKNRNWWLGYDGNICTTQISGQPPSEVSSCTYTQGMPGTSRPLQVYWGSTNDSTGYHKNPNMIKFTEDGHLYMTNSSCPNVVFVDFTTPTHSNGTQFPKDSVFFINFLNTSQTYTNFIIPTMQVQFGTNPPENVMPIVNLNLSSPPCS